MDKKVVVGGYVFVEGFYCWERFVGFEWFEIDVEEGEDCGWGFGEEDFGFFVVEFFDFWDVDLEGGFVYC